ncbi:uncharacterized protein DUF3179 [Marinimicrobium koreense]|uniref:Uncharacterized protein DUF3179 n=1 Tax=Marinimicrobium koreense TaxID=306545 RepID=A0A3N1P3X9_9GAMM|nr:DUF3179 domain-containing protein [Marinimicrobium koreense]ROQ21420.1 uncharacterized protein DUF3179 [Marinimicrobium koreense]
MKIVSLVLCIMLLSSCGGSSSGSGGGSDDNGSTPESGEWLIPESEVLDGGPGKDGIPAISDPNYLAASQARYLDDSDLVVGVNLKGEVRAYPHRILDWHEIINEHFGDTPYSISYCPLTGSALLWEGRSEAADPTYGVSGLLFNSNLILYDRETDSYWSQMLAESVRGPRAGEEARRLAVVETTWGNWRAMYPDSQVMDTQTGFSRDYNRYPYGSFRTDNNLIFPVSDRDERLHLKTRVLGVRIGEFSKVYPIENFTEQVEVINEVNDGYVVVGSSGRNFAMAFNAVLDDGTQLTFEAVADGPVVMEDQEGTRWDIFGRAQSGMREGEQLEPMFSYIAYWFAWAAFFPGAEVYEP